MSMIIVHGLKNCDTCRNAIKWLDAKGIAHEFRDIRKDGLALADVLHWLASVGADTLVNRRGTTWRQRDEAEKSIASDDEFAALILKYPAIMKRPVFVTGNAVIVGFRDEHKTALSSLR